MITLSGIGVHDVRDIPLKTLDAAKNADLIFLEGYTNFYHSTVDELVEVLAKPIDVVKRSFMEENLDDLVELGKTKNVLVLVPGDALSATTHMELLIECRQAGVECRVIYASSVFTAISVTGLQLYKFGKTCTLSFFEDNYKPTSPYKVIGDNMKLALHSLCLLDVKSDEDRYMSVGEGLETILEMERIEGKALFSPDTLVVGCARLGGDDYVVKSGRLSEIKEFCFGIPPHCIIIPGNMHFKEEEALDLYKI